MTRLPLDPLPTAADLDLSARVLVRSADLLALYAQRDGAPAELAECVTGLLAAAQSLRGVLDLLGPVLAEKELRFVLSRIADAADRMLARGRALLTTERDVAELAAALDNAASDAAARYRRERAWLAEIERARAADEAPISGARART